MQLSRHLICLVLSLVRWPLRDPRKHALYRFNVTRRMAVMHDSATLILVKMRGYHIVMYVTWTIDRVLTMRTGASKAFGIKAFKTLWPHCFEPQHTVCVRTFAL